MLDASALVDLLLRRVGPEIIDCILANGETLHAPHLIDLEVLQAFRRLERNGRLSPAAATVALEDFCLLRVQRYAHGPLRARIWELRHVLTSYDAAYLALAEALACPLLTRDVGLARCAAARTKIELV